MRWRQERYAPALDRARRSPARITYYSGSETRSRAFITSSSSVAGMKPLSAEEEGRRQVEKRFKKNTKKKQRTRERGKTDKVAREWPDLRFKLNGGQKSKHQSIKINEYNRNLYLDVLPNPD